MASAKPGAIRKFDFIDDSQNVHMNQFVEPDGVIVLQLMASRFSHDIFDAVDEWDKAKSGDADVQNEKAKLLTILSPGPSGYSRGPDRERKL